MQCWQPTKQKDIVTNNSLSLCNLWLHMNLRFQLLWLHVKFSSSYLLFITAASRNDTPTGPAHRNTILFFHSPFICLAVTLQYLWILTVEHKDRHCKCNVTLDRVRVTVVAVAKKYLLLQIMRMCLYSCLSLPAHKAHTPYYIVISDLSGSNIFLQIISKNDKIFGGKKKLLTTKYVFWFSLKILSEIFLILRRTERERH